MDGWPSCWHCSIVWYVTKPSCAALHRLTQPSIPSWVGEVSTSNEGDWWNMCIPDRFTAPRGSLVACMLPRELRWEEVAPPHKGMTQLKVPVLGSYKLHVKCLWKGIAHWKGCYINVWLYLVILSTVVMWSLSASYCGSFSCSVLYTIVMSL